MNAACPALMILFRLMKRHAFVIIGLCILLMQTIMATAQIDVGIKGGLQLSQMRFKAEDMGDRNRGGFFIGPTLRIGTPVVGLSVDVSALYDQRNLKVEDVTIKQQTLCIPANIRLGTSLFDEVGIFVFMGPQFDFNLGDSQKYWKTDKGDNRQFIIPANTLSANFGLGLIVNRFEGNIYYNLPLGRTGDFTWDQLSKGIANNEWGHTTARTNAWRLSLAYYF